MISITELASRAGFLVGVLVTEDAFARMSGDIEGVLSMLADACRACPRGMERIKVDGYSMKWRDGKILIM